MAKSRFKKLEIAPPEKSTKKSEPQQALELQQSQRQHKSAPLGPHLQKNKKSSHVEPELIISLPRQRRIELQNLQGSPHPRVSREAEEIRLDSQNLEDLRNDKRRRNAIHRNEAEIRLRIAAEELQRQKEQNQEQEKELANHRKTERIAAQIWIAIRLIFAAFLIVISLYSISNSLNYAYQYFFEDNPLQNRWGSVRMISNPINTVLFIGFTLWIILLHWSRKRCQREAQRLHELHLRAIHKQDLELAKNYLLKEGHCEWLSDWMQMALIYSYCLIPLWMIGFFNPLEPFSSSSRWGLLIASLIFAVILYYRAAFFSFENIFAARTGNHDQSKQDRR